MALLDLLFSGFVGILSCQLLVLFFLRLLKFLPFFLLLCVHLVLLFLVFLVLLGVSRVWRSGALNRRKLVGMDGRRTTCIVFRRHIASSCIASCISWTAMNCTGLAGGHYSAIIKGCRLRRSCDWRLATIHGRTQLWIGPRGLHVLALRSCGRKMADTRGRLFLRGGARLYAAVSSVVADASDVALIDNGRVVHVMNDGDVHIVHGAIVEKAVVVPTSAVVTVAEVSVAIVDPAIKSHHSIRPVPCVEDEPAAAPSPIAWSPQKAYFGRENPSPRHPVIIVVVLVPGPVARRPDITFTRANGLFVNGQIRGREPNRDAHTDLCRR